MNCICYDTGYKRAMSMMLDFIHAFSFYFSPGNHCTPMFEGEA